MHVQHGASVLVIDGRKALLLRNEGDGEYLNLRLAREWEQNLPPDRELKSEGPGRTFSSDAQGKRRSSYEETDFHHRAEVAFASSAAEFLKDQLRLRAIEEVVIVAPPRTLGVLRKHLDGECANRVAAEIGKDLVGHSIESIECLIRGYPEPG